ncbi:uncharacterized protein LOC108864127 [Galendromus occidentalis]|uniref:Uncharacterized protein LOC108864127 n=1 Tax=Galendromus occidentalis TaxID=34638 RepID=A0AAJ7L3M6_9ACAR|nr:uncharacterized protein LOC108864127 [Galendromus occidentalis]
MKLCYDFDPAMSEERVIERCRRTLRSEEAYALLSVRPKTINELRAHLSWIDKTIPHLNERKSSQTDPAINRVGRYDRSEERSRSPSRERPISRPSSIDRQSQLQHQAGPSGQAAHYRHRSRSPAPAASAAYRAPFQRKVNRGFPVQQRHDQAAFNPKNHIQGYTEDLEQFDENGRYTGNRRLPDGRVLCNFCNNIGHTYKYCRRRLGEKDRTLADWASANSSGR